ncbi:hypothetical protein [Marinobacterium jannaschii]|uniref:hypothetical protein n=1 Tax=Marinobacterium jannaschii TaxID=64970 RepID=UPI000486B954|nr:hypothetical protein [Marinobacterium jannaschii]
MLILAGALSLSGCAATAVQPQAAAISAEQSQALAEESARAEQIQKDVTALAGRMTAVQDRLLQLSSQTALLQEQGQRVLRQLQQLRAQQAAQPAADDGTEGAAEQDALLEDTLDQVTAMVNDLTQQMENGSFRISSTYTDAGKWVLIRYDRFTGQSWFADQGQWIDLEDMEQLPPSDYEVVLLRADKDVKGYVATRLDRQSGLTWWLKQNSWQPYE